MRWRPNCRPDRTLSSRGDTALESVADDLLRQFAADEDETALARFAVLPGPLVIALQHHVHALKHIAVVIVAEGENSLRAQNLLALAGDEVLPPGHELGGIERLVRPQRQRLHILVVVMLQAARTLAVAVAVIVVMVMAVVMMIVIVAIAGVEEFRFDLEDAVEIERAAFQHVR